MMCSFQWVSIKTKIQQSTINQVLGDLGRQIMYGGNRQKEDRDFDF